jgi:hypothetical protein
VAYRGFEEEKELAEPAAKTGPEYAEWEKEMRSHDKSGCHQRLRLLRGWRLWLRAERERAWNFTGRFFEGGRGMRTLSGERL